MFDNRLIVLFDNAAWAPINATLLKKYVVKSTISAAMEARRQLQAPQGKQTTNCIM